MFLYKTYNIINSDNYDCLLLAIALVTGKSVVRLKGAIKMDINFKKIAIFAGGTIFGSVGLKLLGSKDARKVYAHTTAAVLRAKESVMTTVTKIQESADDILAEGKDINEMRSQAAEKEIVEDAAETQEAEEVAKK